MAERLGPSLRPTGMRATAVASLFLAGLLVTGCGTSGDAPDAAGTASTAPATACPTAGDGAVVVAHADLDGDGAAEAVTYSPATAGCGPLLSATVQGTSGSVALDDDLPIRPADSFAISVPGRSGDVAVVVQKHPRGGFQVVLLAWSAGAGLSTLNVDDHPVFPFVATDVEPSPITARCVRDGFEIDQARRHEPVGVVPAWDVERTRYTLNGTTTTAGRTEEIADNVLEKQLRADYRDLLRHVLFENCRAGS
jgi:hypothetical protein